MISSDFSMYYGGTWVGYRQGGVILPFSVAECSIPESFVDRVNSAGNRVEREALAFSDEARDLVTFHGQVWNPETDRSSNKVVSYTSENLVLELPDPTYIKCGNDAFSWVSYHANRSTKKGIDTRKVCFSNRNLRLDKRVVFKMFNVNEPEIIGRVLLKHRGHVEYKGLRIGNFTGHTTIELKYEAKHLLNLVAKEFPECQVTLAQPQ